MYLMSLTCNPLSKCGPSCDDLKFKKKKKKDSPLIRGVIKKLENHLTELRLITVFYGSVTVTVIKIEKPHFTVWLWFSVLTHGY